MNGSERRRALRDALRAADNPVSGTQLGKTLGVSRQVIVQDIALLRSQGIEIVSTSRGYRIDAARPERTLKVRHLPEDTRAELNAIVDLGGRVEDVSVNHRTYGRITAPMGIASRRDVDRFIGDLETGTSSLLMTVTSGYHFHRVSADNESVLDDIEHELSRLGFCAKRLPYERDMR